jgi:hypothetical protein
MAYGTIMEQLLRNPEELQKGIVASLLEDIRKQAVDEALEMARPAIEKTVNERLTKLRVFLEREMSGQFFDIRAFYNNEQLP